MSDSKKANKTEQHQPVKSKRKKLLFVLLAVLVLLVFTGAGFGYRWWQDRTAQEDTTVTDLQDLRLDGDESAFESEADRLLNDPSTDNQTRAQIYVQKGGAAFDSGNFQQAVDFYLEADNYDPTHVTAHLVAGAYAELGDNQRAIEYYQLTIDRYPTESPIYQTETDYYQFLIDELRGGGE